MDRGVVVQDFMAHEVDGAYYDSDDESVEEVSPGAGTGLTPEELFERKMQVLARSVIKSGQLRTRRRVGLRQRKRDKIFHKVIGEWALNTVFIDNEKVIVQNLEVTSQRMEIMLNSIKHVVPVDGEPEFAITWTAREREEVATRSPLRQKEQEDGEFSFSFGGDSDFEEDSLDHMNPSKVTFRDEVLVFRANTMEEAREWVNSINKAIQVSQSTKPKSSFTQLREYNTAIDDGPALQRQSTGHRLGRRNKSRLYFEAEEMWTRNNREAKQKAEKPLETLGRTAGAIAASLSINMVGGIVKSALKAVSAPSTFRRATATRLQTIWVDAIVWLLPPQLFHLSGDVPKPANLRRSSRHSKRHSTSSRRSSRRRSLPSEKVTRIFLMNSACEADVIYMMFVAKALEDAQGNVKAFLSLRERVALLGLGSLFELFGFTFLSRRSKEDREMKDRKNVARHYRALHADRAYEWSLIFPERGWATKDAIQEQRLEEPGRPELDTLLLPDANELIAALEALEDKQVEIYDVTIAYEGYSDEVADNERELYKNRLVPSYRNLLSASASTDIHMNIVRFDPKDVLLHPGGTAGWLDERWQMKDHKLKHFSLYTAFPPENEEEVITRDAFSVEGNIKPMVALWVINLVVLLFTLIYLFI